MHTNSFCQKALCRVSFEAVVIGKWPHYHTHWGYKYAGAINIYSLRMLDEFVAEASTPEPTLLLQGPISCIFFSPILPRDIKFLIGWNFGTNEIIKNRTLYVVHEHRLVTNAFLNSIRREQTIVQFQRLRRYLDKLIIQSFFFANSTSLRYLIASLVIESILNSGLLGRNRTLL